MNLLHLYYFHTVAKEGGFLKASNLLRIQQPAISRMVKQLEDHVGFALFERTGRQVRLTSQGMEVFEHSKRIFAEVERLQMSVGQIGGECQGPLTIASAEPIASHFLPKKITTLMEKHPRLYPNIFSGPAAMLFEPLLKGEIELGLFFHIPDLPERLEIFRRIPTRFHLVVRRDLRGKSQVLKSFIGSREIDDVSTRRFPTLERLRRDHPEAKITISSNNLTSHKEMVLQGLGVSILPEFLIKEELHEKKTLVDLYPKENFVFDMKCVKRKTAILSLNANEFMLTVSG